MAKSDVVNRSELIRECLKNTKSWRERMPKAVSDALKAKGINVSTQLVSQVKSSLKKKTKRTKAKKQVAPKKQHENFQTWIFAKNLLNAVGGDLATAKKNLEIVSKLLS